MKIYRFCAKYLTKFKTRFIIYTILSMVLSIFSLISPYITGDFVDALIGGGGLKAVYRFCIIFSSISIFRILIGFLSSMIYTKMMLKMGYDFNKDIIYHVQRTSLTYINKTNFTQLNQIINGDTNALLIFCISTLQGLINNVITLIVPIYFLFKINALIALSLSSCLAFYVLLYKFFRKYLYKMGLALRQAQNSFFTKLFEQIQFSRFIKVHSVYNEFHKRHENSFYELSKQTIKSQKLSFLYSGLDNFVSIIAQAFLFIFGGYQILNGNFTIGGFTIFSSYFNLMIGAARYFFSIGRSYQETLVCFSRLNDIVSVPEEKNGEITLSSINSIQITDLSFSYNETCSITYNNVTLQKGNIYGIIGVNGTGKSTLIDLIMGLYIDEKHGKIEFNQVASERLNMVEVRKYLIGLAEQEATLIDDDIIYNIIFENRQITSSEMDRILLLADHLNYSEFIESRIHKPYQHTNKSMSTGEKQKLAILRLLYKNPDLMIFDEPTSFLDSDSCIGLINYLTSIKANKIIILVTHDQAISNKCDIIISL